MKITKDMKIGELMDKVPEAAEKLMDAGMGCAMCPMAQMETIEQGCLGHGMSEKDIEKLMKELNTK